MTAKEQLQVIREMILSAYFLWKNPERCGIMAVRDGNRNAEKKGKSIMWKRFLIPLLQMEQTIKEYRREEQWLQVRNITLMAVLSFLLMSVLNAYQHSLFMLVSTLSSAFVLLACLLAGWKKKNTGPVEVAYLIVFLLLFTYYILVGGNDGFAILWVVFVPILYMLMIDVKKGLFLSIYFLVLLFLVFYGPLGCLLRYDYPRMVRLRFPVLYLIDFALSFYSVRQMILTRSSLILAQSQLLQASFLDVTTGLKNRSAFTDFANTISGRNFDKLSVVYIDVNGLHELNNREGHAEGDKMLRFVADACVEEFPHASIFRLGGDEFLLVCSVCTESEIDERMAKLNSRVEAAGYTIAYGIEHRVSDFHLEEMVNCADSKMLRNKAEYYKKRDRRVR